MSVFISYKVQKIITYTPTISVMLLSNEKHKCKHFLCKQLDAKVNILHYST